MLDRLALGDMMKKMTLTEQKKVLVDILSYIDKTCRENDIKYSLMGGSLIGAIRHKGIIPWDDDVDVILMPKEYEKLLKILSKQSSKYHLINPRNSNDFPYPFAKLADADTLVEEKDVKGIEEYGVYVDIFGFHYVSNWKIARRMNYLGLVLRKKAIRIKVQGFQKIRGVKPFFRNIVYFILKPITIKKIKRGYIKHATNTRPTRYVLSDWPSYGFKGEVEDASLFDSYSDYDFENIKVMICDGYDKVLTAAYGDYMKLPPKEERRSKHQMIAYWKDKK